MRREIEDGVAKRRGRTASGEEAVSEATWLLNRLCDSDIFYCSDEQLKINMPIHMKEMGGIVQRLTSNPSASLRIAAMLHDGDRFLDGYYVMIKDEPPIDSAQFRNYYKPIQHPRMATEFIIPLLQLLNIDPELTARANILIRNHESGIAIEEVQALEREVCLATERQEV